MGHYDYPLPPSYLATRYKPFLSAAMSGKAATLVALPHTGRTSMLRFLLADSTRLTQIGIDALGAQIKLVDPDLAGPTFSGYLREIYTAIGGTDSGVTHDDYLLSRAIVSHKSRTQVVLILTLNHLTVPFISDLDRFATMVNKGNSAIHIVWSADTIVWKSFRPGHSSTSFFANPIYYPTFDSTETLHSIVRHLKARGRSAGSINEQEAYSCTGGISGLFHPFVDTSGDLPSSPVTNMVVTDIAASILGLDESILGKLTTPTAQLALAKLSQTKLVSVEDIVFLNYPTSQEINLIRVLKGTSGVPVTRDELAQAMWGKGWENNYSDWAIDKAINRLRAKVGGGYKIIAVRNIGYRLEKLG